MTTTTESTSGCPTYVPCSLPPSEPPATTTTTEVPVTPPLAETGSDPSGVVATGSICLIVGAALVALTTWRKRHHART